MGGGTKEGVDTLLLLRGRKLSNVNTSDILKFRSDIAIRTVPISHCVWHKRSKRYIEIYRDILRTFCGKKIHVKSQRVDLLVSKHFRMPQVFTFDNFFPRHSDQGVDTLVFAPLPAHFLHTICRSLEVARQSPIMRERALIPSIKLSSGPSVLAFCKCTSCRTKETD